MKCIVTFCALCALLGCRAVVEPSGEAIALYCSTSEQSKTDVLTSGDQLSVFACIEGTEDYFLDNAKFAVGSDGRSLSTSPAVYYPEAKQAVRFFACFPYHSGGFSVPSDQSTALALQQADLCWATARSTPAKTAVPLAFAHQLARLVITTNQASAKIVAPNVFSGGTLDIRTGVFTNTLKADISTTGNELIVPVQTIARLILTIAGIDYTFEGAISLESAKTTTANLTLHPATKTATLSGSSTTNWISSASESNPTQAVSNVLTLHWPSYLPQGATPDKVVFAINNVDYTISSGITYADKTFTVPFASSVLRYPYTITKITFYQGATQVVPICTQLLGATIYKSSASTLGIKDVSNAILINGLWWATGNLIADGANGCKIGAPTDYGLYFRFGSLVGWSGGATGDGVGQGTPSLSIRVQPIGYTGGTTWATVGYNTKTGTYSPSTNFYTETAAGNEQKIGVGDPCSFYLGAPWVTPTRNEYKALFNNAAPSTPLSGTGGFSWQSSPSGLKHSLYSLFYMASGARQNELLGGFVLEATTVILRTCSALDPSICYTWSVTNAGIVETESGHFSFRTHGLPVRCVAE